MKAKTRINPLYIDAQENDVTAAATAVSGTEEVTSRVIIEQNGICPICNTPMVIRLANDIEVFACMKDRVVFPTKDQ